MAKNSNYVKGVIGMNLFQSPAFLAVERGLDGATLRQRAITQNIANVDTPNYKAKNVSFKEVLNQELHKKRLSAYRTDERHIPFSNEKKGPFVWETRTTTYNHNGNNVDIDVEMAELAKNQIYYNALIDRLNGQFQSLQTVIRGGR